jgi:ribosomal protein S21
MTNEEIRAMLKLFARQLEIATELKQIKEAKIFKKPQQEKKENGER